MTPALALVLVLGVAVIEGEEETVSSPATGGLAEGSVPSEYASLIVRAAEQCEAVTAPLLAAQLAQESAFRPEVISGAVDSSAGARGIAQFLPSTWAAYGEDFSGDGTASILDPADAIPTQAKYMCDIAAQLRPRLDSGQLVGDLQELMLAGYNAGPYAVIEYGGIPPYPETQHYVSTITASIRQYQDSSFQPPGSGAGMDPSACTVDENLPRPNPASCAEAIAKARTMVDGQCSWYQMCLAFTAVAYGWAASGQYSAWTQYQQLRSLGHIRKTRNPPPGALVFWIGDGPYGHVAIAVGDGLIASNDIRRSGCIDIVPWTAPETEWGQHYLGWSPPYFPNGV